MLLRLLGKAMPVPLACHLLSSEARVHRFSNDQNSLCEINYNDTQVFFLFWLFPGSKTCFHLPEIEILYLPSEMSFFPYTHFLVIFQSNSKQVQWINLYFFSWKLIQWVLLRRLIVRIHPKFLSPKPPVDYPLYSLIFLQESFLMFSQCPLVSRDYAFCQFFLTIPQKNNPTYEVFFSVIFLSQSRVACT